MSSTYCDTVSDRLTLDSEILPVGSYNVGNESLQELICAASGNVISAADFDYFRVTTTGERNLYLLPVLALVEMDELLESEEEELHRLPMCQLVQAEELHDVVAEIHGKQLALIEDICVFGADPRWRDFQRTNPIVCLGSRATIRETEVCPCIYGRGNHQFQTREYGRPFGHVCHILLKDE